MQVDISIKDSVAILTLNNPDKLNALSSEFVCEIYEKVQGIESHAKVLIITGCRKAFAAGVDVKEIDSQSYESAYLNNFIDDKWESIYNVKIPVIAAVSGYALGGGFELALMSDIIIAAKNALFGFPEINLGLIPGMGGTQMLTRLVGVKAATEILLSGDYISAEQALKLNIVSKVVGEDELMNSALAIAEKISKKSIMSIRMIKEAIRLSQNTSLTQGVRSERQMFRSLFSTSFKEDLVKKFLKR